MNLLDIANIIARFRFYDDSSTGLKHLCIALGVDPTYIEQFPVEGNYERTIYIALVEKYASQSLKQAYETRNMSVIIKLSELNGISMESVLLAAIDSDGSDAFTNKIIYLLMCRQS